MKKIIAIFKKLLKIFWIVISVSFILSYVVKCKGIGKTSAESGTPTNAISCAEVSDASETENLLDPLNYPTANLIDVEQMANNVLTVENGIVCMMQQVYYDQTQNYRFSGKMNYKPALPAGNYCFSWEVIDYKFEYTNPFNLAVTYEDGTQTTHTMFGWQSKREITFNKNIAYMQFYFQSEEPLTSFYKFQKLMLNVGLEPKPYIPPFSLIEGNKYNEGYEDGKSAGYSDGAAVAQYGYFSGATLNGTLNDVSNGGSETNINFNITNIPYISGGLDFGKLTQPLEALLPSTDYSWGRTDIYVNLKNSVVAAEFNIIAYGTSTSFYSTPYIITDEGEKIAAEWETQEGVNGKNYALKIPYEALKKNVSKLLFEWGGGVDGLAVYIIQADLGFFAGQSAGYNEGLKEGKSYGYDQGYEDGESAGYNAGKEAAIVEGVNGTGIFYALIQILRMLFVLFTDLLTAKIAGDLTVGLFVVGIPMTFVVIDMIIGLVRKFTGRTGGNE